MHPYTLSDPKNTPIAKKYLVWVREVSAALASGVRVRTRWSGDYHTPESWREELRREIDKRINLRGGGLPTSRKWDSDYHYQALRDSRRIRDHAQRRIAIHQFETKEARRRFAHLLSDRPR